MARWLGLRSLLRKGYYWWARPTDGILKLSIAGVPVQFAVHTPEELRVLESAGGAGGEERVLELLVSYLKPGDVVFDVGGNVGLYTAVLAKTVGPDGLVVVFEPDRQNYSHLQENLELNGLSNVRCFQKALGDKGGQAKLYSSKVIGNMSLVHQEGEGGVGEMVDIAVGDDLIASTGLAVPRVVKVDVEGFEFAVLQGLRKTLLQPKCQLVCCEVHPSMLPPDVKPGAVKTLLEEVGFERIESYPRWDGTFHLAAYKEGHPGQ